MFIEKHEEVYAKLLRFIDTTEHYRPDRLYGLLPSDGMFLFMNCCFYPDLTIFFLHADCYEAKAILLGRLGRHDGALEIYAYRLQNFQKAEE